MISITIMPDKLYAVSAPAFCSIIPQCKVDFTHDSLQMQFNMNAVASSAKKKERREITAMVLTYCSDEQVNRFSTWLLDYFSENMQKDIFDLIVCENGKIIPCKQLEKAINNLRKR